MIKITSSNNQALINPLGAELKSLIVNNQELIYQPVSESGFWQRSSPVLFPIVGRLNNNKYTYKEQPYTLGQHGFARDMPFKTVYQTENEVQLLLKSTKATLDIYPFEFELNISYTLIEKQLLVEYTVVNTNEKEIYYSIGAHPAFKLEQTLENYALQFKHDADTEWYGLSNGVPTLQNSELHINHLQLNDNLFQKDTLILKKLNSKTADLFQNAKHILSVTCNTPYFGIWKQAEAPFICLEPWWGIADFENNSGPIEQKAGILCIEPKGQNSHHWQINWPQ